MQSINQLYHAWPRLLVPSLYKPHLNFKYSRIRSVAKPRKLTFLIRQLSNIVERSAFNIIPQPIDLDIPIQHNVNMQLVSR